jgi:hypothetical protein
LGQYFDYLKARKEMPPKGKPGFDQYLQLTGSLNRQKRESLSPLQTCWRILKRNMASGIKLIEFTVIAGFNCRVPLITLYMSLISSRQKNLSLLLLQN